MLKYENGEFLPASVPESGEKFTACYTRFSHEDELDGEAGVNTHPNKIRPSTETADGRKRRGDQEGAAAAAPRRSDVCSRFH